MTSSRNGNSRDKMDASGASQSMFPSSSNLCVSTFILSSCTGDWLKTLKPSSFCGIAMAQSTLAVLALREATSLLDQSSDKGVIGNREYTAAQTCGDGACALHCIFGAISASGELKLDSARECVQNTLPLTWGALHEHVMQHASGMERELAELQNMLWKDFALPYAKHERFGLASPSPEATAFWKHLDEDVRTQFLAKAEEAEEAEDAVALLADVSRAFFVEGNEESLVRPLSVALNYLPDLHDVDVDYLDVSVDVAGAFVEAREGSLLLPSDAGPFTKYQSLFLGDAIGEEARRRYFMNLPHAMRPKLDEVLKRFESECPLDSQAVVGSLREAVAQRFRCYESDRAPAGFTEEVAWTAYRSAILEDSYWFTMTEASLFAALANLRLQVVDSSFQALLTSAAPADFEEVVVLLHL